MYAETLEVPHYLKRQPEQAPQQLLDSMNLPDVRQVLADAQATNVEAYNAAKIEAVEAISKEVSRALWYPEHGNGRDDYERLGISYPVGLQEIEQKQVANCFGYTFTTSEIFEEVGIDHWVAYGNGHAFLLVPTQAETGEERTYLVDPLSPHFNQYLNASMRRGTAETVRSQLDERHRAAFMLDTSHLMRSVVGDMETLIQRHPWLSFEKSESINSRDQRDMYFGGGDIDERNRLQRRFMIIVSAYEPEDGRRMIEEYVGYQQAIANDDVPGAYQSLRELSGYFPEIDARQNHAEFRMVVDGLCGSGQYAEALQLIHDYFKNFEEVSKDSRLNVSKGDCLRGLAESCGSVAIRSVCIDLAEEQYKIAEKNPRSFKAQVQGKLRALQAKRNELGLASD